MYSTLAKRNKTISKTFNINICTTEAKLNFFNFIKSKNPNWDTQNKSNDEILQSKISGFCSSLNKKLTVTNRTKNTIIKKLKSAEIKT